MQGNLLHCPALRDKVKDRKGWTWLKNNEKEKEKNLSLHSIFNEKTD